MKRIIAVWLVMLMVMGGMIGIVNLLTDAENDNGDAEIRSASKSGLTAHDPIYINGNEDFANQSAEEGWVGDGTEGNPYVIENYNVDASKVFGWYQGGITIKNTDVYFIIRNCIIHDGKNSRNKGIWFDKVKNGKIDAVTSYNNYAGIWLCFYSPNNQITNCAVYNNKYEGIKLHDSPNTTITNCSVHNNDNGIYLYGSPNCKIHYCNIYQNTYGIYNYESEAKYQVDATNNWWGSASGPSGVGSGSGDKVSSNVLYKPWVTEPPEGAGWTTPTTLSEIPWLYIIIPVIIIVVLTAVGISISRRKKGTPPPEKT